MHESAWEYRENVMLKNTKFGFIILEYNQVRYLIGNRRYREGNLFFVVNR